MTVIVAGAAAGDAGGAKETARFHSGAPEFGFHSLALAPRDDFLFSTPLSLFATVVDVTEESFKTAGDGLDAGLTGAAERNVTTVDVDAGAVVGTQFAVGRKGRALVDTAFLIDILDSLPTGKSLTPGAVATPVTFVSAGGDGATTIVSEVSGGVAALLGSAFIFGGW